jgi:hypothetical protein
MPSPRRSLEWRTLLAVAVAAVVVISGVGVYFEVLHPHVPTNSHPAPVLGPWFNLSATTLGPLGVGEAGATWVSVVSFLPSLMPSERVLVNVSAPYAEVTLLLEETNSAGKLVGNLNATNWSLISNQWPFVVGQNITSVSLWMDATFEAFNNSTNEWDIYSYDDAVAFDPWNPPTYFSEDALFNLADPVGTAPALPAPRTGEGTFDANCGPNPSPQTVVDYNGFVTGPFPILMLNDTRRQLDGPLVSMGDVVTNSAVAVNFTGATGVDIGGTFTANMGTGTTWGMTAPAVNNGAATGAPSDTAQAFAMIYFGYTMFHVYRTTEYIGWRTQPSCNLVSVGIQRESTSIVNMPLGIGVSANSANQSFGWLLHQAELQDVREDANLTTSAGSSQYWSNMMAMSPGVNATIATERRALRVASPFLTPLDVGLFIATAWETCGTGCGASGAAAALEQVDAALGPFSSIANSIGSFSYVSSNNTVLPFAAYTANDASFGLELVGSDSFTQLTTPYGTAYPFLPSYVVAW